MSRPPAFEVLTEKAGGVVTVAIRGELDLATVPELDAELQRIRATEGLARVVIDLRQLAFLDSTGLQSIIRFHKAAGADGVDVAVVRGPPAVERLFAVMQMDRSLKLVDDPSDL